MKLEITKERILEAANKCSTAKETLKTLFPEVFEDDKYEDYEDDKYLDLTYANLFMDTYMIVSPCGSMENRGFYLSRNYIWKIEPDNEGDLILIPTKK